MKKKSKSYNFIIPLVVYPFDIMVSIGQTDAEFRKSITKDMPPSILKDLEEDQAILSMPITNDGRTVNLPTGHQTIIRIKRSITAPRDYGILAHEIFHAVSFILMRMGINLEIEKTDEVYAYLIDYVTTETIKRLRK